MEERNSSKNRKSTVRKSSIPPIVPENQQNPFTMDNLIAPTALAEEEDGGGTAWFDDNDNNLND